MLSSPNSRYSSNRYSKDQLSLGNNFISRMFKWPFEVLLTSDYYAGTDNGKIYNEKRPDGRSKIYVDQPALENKLQMEFMDIDDDITKFLVGALGVGKTTLIRNFFKVFDRDIVERDENLVIYVSLYSMVSANQIIKEEKLKDAISNAVQEAITYLSGQDFIERITSYDSKFYEDFYKYVYFNSKYLIHSFETSPSNARKLREGNPYEVILNWISDNNSFDYNLCLLKYYLTIKGEVHPIKNVIFIIDDSESLSLEHTDYIIEVMQSVKKCLQAKRGGTRFYNIKALIALRNYSVRNINKERQREAYREISKSDIILKDTVPSLKDVLSARVNYLMNKKEIINRYSNQEAFDDAVKTLNIILEGLYLKYDDILLALTHNNIFVSMTLLLRIVTNKQFIGRREIDKNGAFDIKPATYVNRGPGIERLKNDDVFYALTYGESNIYVDSGDYYLMNIMHYKHREGANTQLLGLLIIQYLINQEIVFDEYGYDTDISIEGDLLVDEIIRLFSFPTEKQKKVMRTGLQLMMKHLYEGGALLQSLIEPTYEDARHFKRVYHNNMKVFLSRRGKELYSMLYRNALLLEAYRDDIETEIIDNDLPTLKLSKTRRLLYILDYVESLYNIELQLLRIRTSTKILEDTIGPLLPTVVLLHGIRESIRTYYTQPSSARDEVVSKYNTLAKEIQETVRMLNEDDKYSFANVKLI